MVREPAWHPGGDTAGSGALRTRGPTQLLASRTAPSHHAQSSGSDAGPRNTAWLTVLSLRDTPHGTAWFGNSTLKPRDSLFTAASLPCAPLSLSLTKAPTCICIGNSGSKEPNMGNKETESPPH